MSRQLRVENMRTLLSAKVEIQISGYLEGSRQSRVIESLLIEINKVICPLDDMVSSMVNLSPLEMPLGNAKYRR